MQTWSPECARKSQPRLRITGMLPQPPAPLQAYRCCPGCGLAQRHSPGHWSPPAAITIETQYRVSAAALLGGSCWASDRQLDQRLALTLKVAVSVPTAIDLGFRQSGVTIPPGGWAAQADCRRLAPVTRGTGDVSSDGTRSRAGQAAAGTVTTRLRSGPEPDDRCGHVRSGIARARAWPPARAGYCHRQRLQLHDHGLRRAVQLDAPP